jgi:3-phosphoshikimate 1-carboxyvinyltransferase
MRARIRPGSTVGGAAFVPGDKSIAHRWLLLAATAEGRSRIAGLPPSLDVRATARCLARLSPEARPGLDTWLEEGAVGGEGHGSTWNARSDRGASPILEVEGEGRSGLVEPAGPLDCANSGTTMRLLAGVLASTSLRTTLVGDGSLMLRPMERVAEPLRAMGATIRTTEGHAPLGIDGATLVGIVHESAVPSAQVKAAVLLAGIDAEGETTVRESAATRDHTERALAALGAPVEAGDRAITVRRFRHRGFAGTVPGDVSSAAFLVVAAAISGATVEVEGVGLNPSRTRFLDVLTRMGVAVELDVTGEELGEPVGALRVSGGSGLVGTEIDAEELPLVIDEVPILAVAGCFASGSTSFRGADELRVKESDRIAGLVAGIAGLGGDADGEGGTLLVRGAGLRGGSATSRGDHRLAMALAVGALAAEGPSEIDGIEAASVSFPGFVATLRGLGASVEEPA